MLLHMGIEENEFRYFKKVIIKYIGYKKTPQKHNLN